MILMCGRQGNELNALLCANITRDNLSLFISSAINKSLVQTAARYVGLSFSTLIDMLIVR